MGNVNLENVAIGGIFGVAFGILFGSYLTNPTSVFSADLNRDGRYDLIVKNNGTFNTSKIFLQQNDGSYVPLGSMISKEGEEIYAERDSIEARAKRIRR